VLPGRQNFVSLANIMPEKEQACFMKCKIAYFDHDILRSSMLDQLAQSFEQQIKTFSKAEDLAAAASWRPDLVIWHGSFLAAEFDQIPTELKSPAQWLVGPNLLKLNNIENHLEDPWKPEQLLDMVEKRSAQYENLDG
jgi:hypothetical protein